MSNYNCKVVHHPSILTSIHTYSVYHTPKTGCAIQYHLHKYAHPKPPAVNAFTQAHYLKTSNTHHRLPHTIRRVWTYQTTSGILYCKFSRSDATFFPSSIRHTKVWHAALRRMSGLCASAYYMYVYALCVYVYVYVCMCTCVCVFVYVYYACTCMYMCVCVCECVCVLVCVYVYVLCDVNVHVMCMCMCMCMCM
jgi:hypothetical protein